ncbi:hypothetical protein ACQPU1_06585 [Clostridium paraputrificum]|uniref:hypothetical protein n=1 Tax=Clostridium paraputrificum TaxID=29363 RepID=UPI003D358DEF
MLNESILGLFQIDEHLIGERYINAFIENKCDINDLVEGLDRNNMYKYHNDLKNFNYPVIYSIEEEQKINELFGKIMEKDISLGQKIYIYMNSFFRTFLNLEEFIESIIEESMEEVILNKLFAFYKFYGKVINTEGDYIEIDPLYLGTRKSILLKKSSEPDLEWRNVKVNDEVSFDLKKFNKGRIYGKTIKIIRLNSDENLLIDWELYSKALLKISLCRYISEENRRTLNEIRNIDFRAIRKIAKNQELIMECLRVLKNIESIANFLELLGDRNSYKYDEIRSKLCYKPNGKDNEEKLEKLLSIIMSDKGSFENKVNIYMNTPLKTLVDINKFMGLLIENGLEENKVYRVFDKYKFYGKVIYSTGNIVKVQPSTLYLKDIVTIDKRYQLSLKKENVRINNMVIFKINRYYKDTDRIDVQVVAHIVRK